MSSLPLLILALAPAIDEEATRHLYPQATERIAIINFGIIRDSGYWTEDINKGFERGFADNEQAERIAKLLEIEPKSLEKFTICETNAGGPGPERVLFIVNGKFPFEKANKALEELGKQGELTTLTIHDQPVYYNHRSREASYFTLLDDQTLVFAMAKNLITDALDGLKELREPKPALAERLKWEEDAKTYAFRLTGVLPDEAREGLSQVPQFAELAKKMEGYNVLGTLGESPRLKLTINMADAESATQLATTLNGLMNFAKLTANANPRQDLIAILDKVTIRGESKEVNAEVTISAEQFADIVVQNREERSKWEEKAKERREKRRKARDGKPDEKKPADAPKPADSPPKKDG
jgi:hypothetical protein